MKLLNKINKSYLTSSIAVIIPGLILSYFLIIFIFSNETTEILRGNEHRVVQQIRSQNIIPSFYPLIEVEKTHSIFPSQMKDTTLVNPVSKEEESFKEYTSYKIIKNQPYRITVRTPIVEKNDIILSLFMETTLLLILISVVLFFINKKINIRIWTPFYTNLKSIKSFSLQSGKKLILQETNITEFNDLNDQIMRLTDKVVSDYNSLKEFTENASHELQTPLAVIQAKVEILFNNKNLTKDQMVLLETVMENIQRLRRLNQSLLLLTKIENTQFNQIETVHFNELSTDVLHSMKEMFDVKGIHVTVIQKGSFNARMDIQLARQLVSNLISNQLRHTPETGKSSILIEDEKIIFSNDGQQPLDETKVFKRFYKGNQSYNSTGLGLSIIQTICSQNNLSIKYQFNENSHHFILTK